MRRQQRVAEKSLILARNAMLTLLDWQAINRRPRNSHRLYADVMASPALLDIATTLERHDLWRTLGWADVRFRYRRTTLGPFWLTISTGIMIFAIGLLYAGLFHQDISAYISSLAIGIIVWNFFITSITEGCSVFIHAGGYIKAYAIPLPIHVMRLVWRNIIIFLHNALIIAVVWLVFRWGYPRSCYCRRSALRSCSSW